MKTILLLPQVLLLYKHYFYLYQVLELCTSCNRIWISRIETMLQYTYRLCLNASKFDYSCCDRLHQVVVEPTGSVFSILNADLQLFSYRASGLSA